MPNLVKIHVILAALLVATLVLSACSNGTRSPSAGGSTPGTSTSSDETVQPGAAMDGGTQSVEARTLIAQRCANCHGLERVKEAQHDEVGWRSTVQRMRSKGAQVDESQQAAIAAFLAGGGGAEL